MKNRERYIWIGVTVVLLLFLTVIGFAPTALAQSRGKSVEEYVRLFEQVFRFIHDNYVDVVDAEKLFQGAMDGLFQSLDDPYSSYLLPKEMEDITDTTSGKFGGVGLYITKPSRANSQDSSEGSSSLPDRNETLYVRVVSPIEGTPASRASISAGDLITKIEDESTKKMSIDEVVDKLRGDPGTRVTITILREGDIEFQVTLTRAIIEVPTIRKDMIPGGIGYLRIIQFTPLTDDRVEEAIEFFESNGYSSLIIDVRSNPGGLLRAVVDTADLFLSGGIIVSTRSRIPSENNVFTAREEAKVPSSIPIVVLIDKGSASASEILAGALKDRNRAYLIGETTFGKGSVQQVKSLNGSGFKLTMARYYTPSGTNIDHKGVEPHKVVKEKELTEKERESYRKLLEEGIVEKFVQEKPKPNGSEIENFVAKLREHGIVLEERIIRKLIRNEINKTCNSPPVYDLDYDIVLQEAVKMLREGKIKSNLEGM